MDTDGAGGQGGEEPREQRGESSSSDEGSSRGDVHSENPELKTRESVEFRGRVGGVQSFHGGVHSVANETLLDSRASSSSSSIRANINRDSMLDRLTRSQFLDPRSKSTRASASATRDVDASQAFRDTYLGHFREPSSRGMAPWGFEEPPMTSSPMHSFEDFTRNFSIGFRILRISP